MYTTVLRQPPQSKPAVLCIWEGRCRIVKSFGRRTKRRAAPKTKQIPGLANADRSGVGCFLAFTQLGLYAGSVLWLPTQMQPPTPSAFGTDTIYIP